MNERSIEDMLQREMVANRPKHWVRAVTACNSKCLFCLDSDTPRNVYLPPEEIQADMDRGREQLGATKVIISGGEPTMHPEFPALVRYAKESGYERVQTVTNGYYLSDGAFYEECIRAGLGEITWSLHGHTEELHDHLTQTPGAFRRILKGIMRAVRDPRVITNVDIVINKQNVAVIDKIMELCINVGVTEFDLLHVIPQAAAFDNRDDLFYDVREHLPVLHKVFRLNRHPGIVVWTNRFPITFLEGLEDLIQDPHKMLDEVNGRRFQVRRYLDTGEPLDCRDPARCPHCFIEPFCTTTDRMVEAQNADGFDTWWVGTGGWKGEQLPYGCTSIGMELGCFADLPTELPDGAGLYLQVADPTGPLPEGRPITLVATEPRHLDAWLGKADADLEVRLNQQTARWLIDHTEQLRDTADRVTIHQPSHEHMQTAREQDVRDPRAFFELLGERLGEDHGVHLRVSGLPACLAPGMDLVGDPRVLRKALFDESTGRLKIRDLARFHISTHYRGKSIRCEDCDVTDRCDGAHINMIRDQGLALLAPLTGAEADAVRVQLPERGRLATGSAAVPKARSLPGYPEPTGAPPDPLALISKDSLRRKLSRRAARRHL